ncbi:response regulator transcription factor, partial [Wenyingzhuangia sp. 1_MG-2023]|nr:response regulator transcription factor [Wenyingzhuangia sp. 1_MG-2023]
QVLIADDHPLFRRALSDALDETGIACSSSECEDFYQVLQTAGQQAIDLLLLDLRMPGNTGLMGLMRLRAEFPQLAIVIVSASEDRMVIEQVRQLGALGYIQKSSTIAGISQALAQVM